MSDYLQPVLKFLRNIWLNHTPNISKTVHLEMSERTLTTFDSLLFRSPEKLEVFYSLNKNYETVGTGDESFITLNIEIGHEKEVYTREYEKISTPLAKVFGVLNLIILIGRLLIQPYCRLNFFIEGMNLVKKNSDSVTPKNNNESINTNIKPPVKQLVSQFSKSGGYIFHLNFTQTLK